MPHHQFYDAIEQGASSLGYVLFFREHIERSAVECVILNASACPEMSGTVVKMLQVSSTWVAFQRQFSIHWSFT